MARARSVGPQAGDNAHQPTALDSLGVATADEDYRGESQAALVWRRFRRQRRGMFGLTVICLLTAAVVVIPYFLPYSYDSPNLALLLAPAGTVDAVGNLHILGTDHVSRDVLTRLLYGGRFSLTLAVMTSVCIVIIGSVIGALSGFYGGWVDNALMRVTDFMLALPILPMYVLLARFFRLRAHDNIDPVQEAVKFALVFVVFGWMGIARLVRASLLSLRNRDFVEASRALGSGDRRIIFRHLLPNTAGPVLVAATLVAGDYIIWEAVLSYFGYGLEDSIAPTWGNLVTASENYIGMVQSFNPFVEINGWLLIFPTILIFLTVLSLNYIGDALQDALDPYRSV